MFPLLRHSPLLVLFTVAAGGFVLGKVRVGRFSLGVSAVLFAGLLMGALVPGVDLPELVSQLGLVLFVYTVGLASGPGFFASLRRRGLRDNGLALGVMALSAGASGLLARRLGLSGPEAAGMFAGALNNTPALAGAVDALKRAGASADALAAPVIACSVTYPLGVLVPMMAVWLAYRLSGAAADDGRGTPGEELTATDPIVNATVLVEHAVPTGGRAELARRHRGVVFGRIRRGTLTTVVHDGTPFAPGDLVTVIGAQSDVAAAAAALGQVSPHRIDLDRSEVDYRRVFVSNRELTGRPLATLKAIQRCDAVVTRVRRGDVDLVPQPDFVLQLGDRARVLAPIVQMPRVERLFGDSLQQVAEVDVITFGLGIALGLVVGTLPLPLPGGGRFALGLAGGPLLVGLVLGRLGRSGPLVWLSAFGANLTLRQFGLVLFLAGVGVRSGRSFAGALATGNLTALFLGGALVTTLSASAALVLGYRFLGIPLDVMAGAVAGIHTQPAVLAFAADKARNDLPSVDYTAVFPIATIAKIVVAQLLLAWAGG
jgi:putative transport protein